MNLDIWGNKIVWEEKEGLNYYLFIYDALKNKTRELQVGGHLSAKERDIFDGYILLKTEFNIKILNINTNKSEIIPSRSASVPKLSEDVLCYANRVGSYMIQCLNLSEDDECKHQIRDNPNSILFLDVYKNNLVWISKIDNQTMVKYYNLSNRTTEKN